MAAVTGAALGVAAAGASIYQGAQQKKKAQAELNSYERQELVNAAEQIEISTRGTDLMREESQRTVANIVDALQGGGARTLGAGVGQLQAGINQTNRQIQVDLDDQINRREYAIADEEARMRGIREERDTQNIGALQSQYAAGDQNMWNGINGAIAATGSLGRAIGDTPKIQTQSQQREVQTSLSNSLTPQGKTYNPFEGIVPPSFTPRDFTEKIMHKGNNIV